MTSASSFLMTSASVSMFNWSHGLRAASSALRDRFTKATQTIATTRETTATAPKMDNRMTASWLCLFSLLSVVGDRLVLDVTGVDATAEENRHVVFLLQLHQPP